MTNIVGIKFKPSGKTYYFDPLEFEIKEGDHVIVETSHGMEFGNVVIGRKQVSEDTIKKPIKPVVRLATAEDIAHNEHNHEREKEAFKVCQQKIREHGLEMKLIEAEYTFDCSKLLFYFTSDGRVDFRELVKDLALIFKTRIELRQIGVRDESKTIGSIGACGRSLCCSQFLDEFMPVSIKMAKEQGLSLNPTKISGACGRLMCCLKYEQDMYEELTASMPRHGERVVTPSGEGVVESVALLRGIVRVKFEENSEKIIKDFDASEVTPIGEHQKKQKKNNDNE